MSDIILDTKRKAWSPNKNTPSLVITLPSKFGAKKGEIFTVLVYENEIVLRRLEK